MEKICYTPNDREKKHFMCNFIIVKIFIVQMEMSSSPCFFFSLFRAAPVAYGSSKPRVWIGAASANPHQSHSNTGSQLHRRPVLQLAAMTILKALSEAKDPTCILADIFCILCQVRNLLGHIRNSCLKYLNQSEVIKVTDFS